MPSDVDDGVVIRLPESGIRPGIFWRSSLEGIASGTCCRVVVGVVAVAASAIGDRFGNMAGGGQEFPKLADRHFMLPHEERFGNAYAVNGRLVFEMEKTRLFVLREVTGQTVRGFVAAHQEFAGRHQDEAHAQGVFQRGRGAMPACCRTGAQQHRKEKNQWQGFHVCFHPLLLLLVAASRESSR